jgi:uncharacterized membrane protein YhdT
MTSNNLRFGFVSTHRTNMLLPQGVTGMTLIVVVVWAIFALGVAIAAHRQGRNLGWLFLACLMSPLFVMIIAIMYFARGGG